MKVSIITAFYHGNAYMNQYVECIRENQNNLNATTDELEVILVNDSPEEQVQLPDDAGQYNIRVINQEANQGIHGARVVGLKACGGDYVMFLDQDDVLVPDAIAKHIAKITNWQQRIGQMHEGNSLLQGTQIEQLMMHPVSVSNALLEQSNGEKLLWYRSRYQKNKVSDYRTYLKVGVQIISPGQCLVPKQMIPELWTTDICKVNGSDDYYLWLLLLSRRLPFQVLDEPLYIHKYTGENLSADTDNTDASVYEFIEYLKKDVVIAPEDIHLLKRQISYKSKFRRENVLKKTASTLKNPDIFVANVIFKLRSKTPYGFNR